jgi:hypothetical protein
VKGDFSNAQLVRLLETNPGLSSLDNPRASLGATAIALILARRSMTALSVQCYTCALSLFEGLPALRHLRSLTSVVPREAACSDAIALLASLPLLERCLLQGYGKSGQTPLFAALRQDVSLPRLIELDLGMCDDSLAHLVAPNLATVTLRDEKRRRSCTGDSVVRFLRSAPRLRSLWLDAFPASETVSHALPHLPLLRSLHVENCKVSGRLLRQWLEAGLLRSLSSLRIVESAAVLRNTFREPGLVARLAARCPLLQEVDLGLSEEHAARARAELAAAAAASGKGLGIGEERARTLRVVEWEDAPSESDSDEDFSEEDDSDDDDDAAAGEEAGAGTGAGGFDGDDDGDIYVP